MRGRAREIPALLFVFIWLMGFEALPLAHVALHAQLAPHTHRSVGHCHGDVCHGEDEDGDTSRAASGDPISHGQDSPEHRGLAVLAPDLTIYVAELTLVGELPGDLPPAVRAEAFRGVSPPARGPPSSSETV